MIFPALVFLGLKNNDCCGCCGNESCGRRFAVRMKSNDYSQLWLSEAGGWNSWNGPWKQNLRLNGNISMSQHSSEELDWPVRCSHISLHLNIWDHQHAEYQDVQNWTSLENFSSCGISKKSLREKNISASCVDGGVWQLCVAATTKGANHGAPKNSETPLIIYYGEFYTTKKACFPNGIFEKFEMMWGSLHFFGLLSILRTCNLKKKW